MSDILVKISIVLAIISFILLNNFFCLFNNALDFERCFHYGFGLAKGKLYYFSEIILGAILLIIVLTKYMYSKSFMFIFLAFSLIAFVPAFSRRLSDMNWGRWDVIYIFYLITFCSYWVVVIRDYRQRKNV